MVVVLYSGCAGDLDELHLDDVDLSLKLSSYVYCEDTETGEFAEYERIYGENNRVWADLEDRKIPKF